MKDESSILTVVELTSDKRIQPISLECLAMGRKIAEACRGRVEALLMGSDIGEAAEELRHFGVSTIHLVDHPLLRDYQPEYYLAAFQQIWRVLQPSLTLMGNTVTLLDLAPRIAFRTDLALITDCIDIQMDSEEMLFVKPVFSGNVTAAFAIPEGPGLATLRKGSIEAQRRHDGIPGELFPHSVDIDPSLAKTEVIERGQEDQDGIELTKADIVVSGGRGIEGPEGFVQLHELSELLRGALGASRPPCDLGWVHRSAQVGLTGAIISPSLYIAVGISGSMQHLQGMSRARVIVAINKDPKANIFNVANYGVVGNSEEVIPGFIECLKESEIT